MNLFYYYNIDAINFSYMNHESGFSLFAELGEYQAFLIFFSNNSEWNCFLWYSIRQYLFQTTFLV